MKTFPLLVLFASLASVFSFQHAAFRIVPKLRKQYTLNLSPMVENMALSKTIEIHALTKELEKSGQKIYSLCVGEPDYQPPKEVIDATSEAALSGNTKYTAVNGEFKLRQAIANDLKARKNIAYSPDQIVVANGAKQSVIQALLAIVSPGEQVLIPAPYWTSYPDMVKMCQAEPVAINTKAADNFELTAEDLELALKKNPKVTCIILCNPSNPTGSVSNKERLISLGKVLEKYPKVFIISDEIYERLTYDNEEHVSFATLSPTLYERTVTINGFSKSHAMTGFRLGYSASNIQIAKAIGKLQSQITSSASSISQAAALAGLEKSPKTSPTWMKDRVTELQAKRDLAYNLLMKIPNVSCPKPKGAFYLLPDVSKYYGKKHTTLNTVVSNGHEFCLALLKTKGVALVPGEAFGEPNTVRMSYATSEEIINESLKLFSEFISELK